MQPIDTYIRKARLVEALDGDTYRLDVDCGFDVWRRVDVRLRGFDAAELETSAGAAARAYVAGILGNAGTLTIQTLRTRTGRDVRSFVRYVANVWIDGVALATMLAAEGFQKGSGT